MWLGSRLVTAERDGYFTTCRSPRPNPGEDEIYARERPLQTSASKSSQENKKSTVSSTDVTDKHTLTFPCHPRSENCEAQRSNGLKTQETFEIAPDEPVFARTPPPEHTPEDHWPVWQNFDHCAAFGVRRQGNDAGDLIGNNQAIWRNGTQKIVRAWVML